MNWTHILAADKGVAQRTMMYVHVQQVRNKQQAEYSSLLFMVTTSTGARDYTFSLFADYSVLFTDAGRHLSIPIHSTHTHGWFFFVFHERIVW